LEVLVSLKLPQRVSEFLTCHHVMTIATQGDGGPWAAAVFYVHDGEGLVFLSSPGSRHCRNLMQYPRGAATIQDECEAWTEIKGIQLEGTVTELSGAGESVARKSYAQRFPMVRGLDSAAAPIAKALAQVRWYRLLPERLRFIDNSMGFGHREEFAADTTGRGAGVRR
jgi:LSD1 subclass zinc finger protein